jgi:glycerol dehydrogenase-like iron-containing ADH family enzyme
VEYLGEARIDRLIVDYDLIKTAPAELNISGAGDILSCHTACWDWKLACERGREPLGYQPETARSSLALVEKLDAAAEEIRRVTNAGIRTLVECEIEIVDICIGPGGPGHFRSEEGSEHFFFYNVERLTRRGFVHGWIVGLGIFLMSRLQENRAAWIAGLMDRLGLPYQPREMCLTREDVSAALLSLRRQTREDGRWWSVIDEREITTPFVAAALEDLRTA